MTGRFKKRALSLLAAFAVSVSAAAVFDRSGTKASAEEATITEEAAVTEEAAITEETNAAEAKAVLLPAPQNLREEDGFIVWDEVEGAYGYTLRATAGSKVDYIFNCFENRVEKNRLCFERQYEFGDITFEVYALDDEWLISEWSNSLTVTYAPTLEKPENVRPGEDGKTIVWDVADENKHYRIHYIYNFDGSDTDMYEMIFAEKYDVRYFGYLYDIQAVDENYNVSDWVSIFVPRLSVLDTPKNVRWDEKEGKVFWDAVDNADYYFFYNQNNDRRRQT